MALTYREQLALQREKLLSAERIDRRKGNQTWEPYKVRKAKWELGEKILRSKAAQEQEAAEAARRKAYNEREERQREIDDRMDKETRWRRLMQKAGLAYKMGKFGAGWTWEDDAWADRLGVEMGYLKPWDRKFSVK